MTEQFKLTIDILGWIGSALILAAYFLNSTHRISSKSKAYQYMNIIGSSLLIINTLHYRTYPIATLNFVWLGIGIISLVHIYRSRASE